MSDTDNDAEKNPNHGHGHDHGDHHDDGGLVDHELGAEQDHHEQTNNSTQDHARNMNTNTSDHVRNVNAASHQAIQNAVENANMMAKSFATVFNLGNLIAIDRTWNLDEVSTLVARSGAVRDAIAAETLRILSQQGGGNS